MATRCVEFWKFVVSGSLMGGVREPDGSAMHEKDRIMDLHVIRIVYFCSPQLICRRDNM